MKTLNHSITILISLIILSAIFSCQKKKDTAMIDLVQLMLMDSYFHPICGSDTPEKAETVPKSLYTQDGYAIGYGTTPYVPAGKKCYYKFVPTTSGIYGFGPDISTNSSSSKVKYHIYGPNTTPDKLPSGNASFNDTFLYANLNKDSGWNDSAASTGDNSAVFFQKANSVRYILVDGTECTSNCEYEFGIGLTTLLNNQRSCQSLNSVVTSSVRFDESDIKMEGAKYRGCHFFFISHKDTTSSFMVTRTSTNTSTITLSVSDPVSAAVSKLSSLTYSGNFLSGASTVTISGMVTKAGQGRYIVVDDTDLSQTTRYTLTNSF